MSEIRLRSVNWMTGMLLAPSHFDAQDDYVDATRTWLLRYCTDAVGLVGSGPRTSAAARGLQRNDPKLDVHDDGGPVVRVTVREVRGITPGGDLVDISATDAVRVDVARSDLAGLTEALVYVTAAGEREEDPSSVGADAANPNAAAFRRRRYVASLGVHADVASSSLIVGKVRRAQESLAFVLDDQFIPPCTTVLAFSSLVAAWERLRSEVAMLGGDFTDLHRRAARYASHIGRRGVDTAPDHDVLEFLERAVLALDQCAHVLADAGQSPKRMFREIERTGRTAALALELSGTTQIYLDMLASIDATYTRLLGAEPRGWASDTEVVRSEDLAISVDRANDTLARLRRLREALSAKYIDYRINKWVDSLRFLIDKDGDGFYTSVATPGHPQRDTKTLTFVFSQLNLTGKQEYRVVLLADAPGSDTWQVGETLHTELRINTGRAPGLVDVRKIPCELMGQRNFAVNFDTPADVAAISSLQVTVDAGERVRGAILFQRRRGLVDQRSGTDSAQRAANVPTPVGPPIKIRTVGAV